MSPASALGCPSNCLGPKPAQLLHPEASLPGAGPQPPSPSPLYSVLPRTGKPLHSWGGGGYFYGCSPSLQNSLILELYLALLWTRKVPARALCEHRMVNGVAWATRELGLGTGDTAVSSGFGCVPGQRARLSGTRGNARPQPQGWLCGGGAPCRKRAPRPRGAVPRQTSPLSFYQLSLARVCLLNGTVWADDCNCSNKILIARSPRVPAAVGVAELSAAHASPGSAQSPSIIPFSSMLRF